MIRTFKYRLFPTRFQHRALETILESQRQLYNAALEERIDAYRKAGIARTFIDQCRALTEWRQSDPDGSMVAVRIQRATLKRLDRAFQAFFRRARLGNCKPGFPRYRGRGRFNTFGFSEFAGVRLEDGRLRFKGMFGWLRVHLHRPIPSGMPIKSCTFSRDGKGWIVCFHIDVPAQPARTGGRAVGVDLGIARLAALSDGGFIPSLRAAQRAQRRLRVEQRSLSRKTRGSRGHRAARQAVARCQAATANARADHLHQATARLIRDYDVIVVERLNVKGLAKGNLAKHIYDASWGEFLSMLRYKAEWAGARMIMVDPYDTSQECSGCGMRVPKELGDRRHECIGCGLIIDRDLNAARNILNRAGVGPGLRNVAGRAACVQAETSVGIID